MLAVMLSGADERLIHPQFDYAASAFPAKALALRGCLEAPRQRGEEMRSEGYLLVATGPAKYLEMARNLATSIRVNDGTRSICLVHDENATLSPADDLFFDDYSLLPSSKAYPGVLNKLQVYGLSPYDRTMFIDVDTLLVKRDIDHYWRVTDNRFFAITGEKLTHGEWKGIEVSQLLREESAPYIVKMNSGVFVWERGEAAETFFAGLNAFYHRRREVIGRNLIRVGLYRKPIERSHEVFLSLYMGLQGMEPCGNPVGRDAWMTSTWGAFSVAVDPVRNEVIMSKPRRTLLGVPMPVLGWRRLSPTLLHFIGQKPAELYSALSCQYMAQLAR